MGWLFDTDGTYWVAVAMLWGVLLVAIPVGIIVGIVTAGMRAREKRDGRR